MAETKKVLGWGRCSIDGHDDIVEDSTSLDIEEGDEQEANIEGGSAASTLPISISSPTTAVLVQHQK